MALPYGIDTARHKDCLTGISDHQVMSNCRIDTDKRYSIIIRLCYTLFVIYYLVKKFCGHIAQMDQMSLRLIPILHPSGFLKNPSLVSSFIREDSNQQKSLGEIFRHTS